MGQSKHLLTRAVGTVPCIPLAVQRPLLQCTSAFFPDAANSCIPLC
jgi:hypothetical protein